MKMIFDGSKVFLEYFWRQTFKKNAENANIFSDVEFESKNIYFLIIYRDLSYLEIQGFPSFKYLRLPLKIASFALK